MQMFLYELQLDERLIVNHLIDVRNNYFIGLCIMVLAYQIYHVERHSYSKKFRIDHKQFAFPFRLAPTASSPTKPDDCQFLLKLMYNRELTMILQGLQHYSRFELSNLEIQAFSLVSIEQQGRLFDESINNKRKKRIKLINYTTYTFTCGPACNPGKIAELILLSKPRSSRRQKIKPERGPLRE